MDFQWARDLHRSVPPEKWCITKAEFEDFVQEVYHLWRSDQVPMSQGLPNPFHWDRKHGPNLHDVNTHVVKPMTRAAGGASYALMKHHQGLKCQVFVSHSWQGGIFHLRRGVSIAWPQLYRLKNLYCCLLSNPQNLDLDEFIGGNVSESAFALALQESSHLLVVPNPSAGVYSRLWCVFEAYLGAKWNKIYLLPVVPDRKETFKYWLCKGGLPMCCGLLVGVPVWLSLGYFFSGTLSGIGLYSWLELIYRALSLLALLVVLPCRHQSWTLPLMISLTSIGCVFFVLDLFWSFILVVDKRDNWISVLLHYGWFSNLTPTNALTTILLVILEAEKMDFEKQKEMMQFHSLRDAHCSNPDDEQRIRTAIAGAEDEVETVISILLAAGAYTDNLRHAWESGLDIERAGMTDVKTGVVFSFLAWSVSAMDLWADTYIGHQGHQRWFSLLSLLYAVTAALIPFSVWKLEKRGPECAVFALKVWGLGGMLSLQLPILLCYLQGYDEVENTALLDFFNASLLQVLDTQTWAQSQRLGSHISCTVLLSRFLCLTFAWALIWLGVDRWNRFEIWLLQSVPGTACASSYQPHISEDSDSSQEYSEECASLSEGEDNT